MRLVDALSRERTKLRRSALRTDFEEGTINGLTLAIHIYHEFKKQARAYYAPMPLCTKGHSSYYHAIRRAVTHIENGDARTARSTLKSIIWEIDRKKRAEAS